MREALVPIVLLTALFTGCLSTPDYTGQNQKYSNSTFEIGRVSIARNSELLESTEFKNDGITYMIEQRYKLPSGQIIYAYYDVEGSNSVTIKKIEETPLLVIGTDINILGLPGYREFNFGDDRRKLVQFMKLFRLGQKDFKGRVNTPFLKDHIFNSISSWRSEFKLLLDLYGETWVLEHRQYSERRLISTDTTAIFHINRYID
jgi:hypothetical protein